MVESNIIIGVPGKWESRTELIQQIALQSEGYLMAGKLISHIEKQVMFEVEVYEHDPNLSRAFSIAGRGNLPPYLLEEIDQHTCTVYLIAKSNGVESTKDLLDVTAGLLRAGGIAVKIEAPGLAYTKEEWYELTRTKEDAAIYLHFVNFIGDSEHIYSIGMHAFGLPDVMVPAHLQLEEFTNLLHNFNLYQILEKPTFHHGETFSLDPDEPVYQLEKLQDFRYDSGDVCFNPSGIWNLVPS
ncbi:DUF4261 domain-containing protein [Risungbinella massiliensis]|uniref:DUF4261 domain-containing protein n=1 Tax=Risungbinella massiliensis TaxID=1329796 RepID=UPI0005CC48A8|nr:DUF4261 domain-containing protein [Risungbinella massiliensis]